MSINIDDHGRLVALLERFLTADAAVRAQLTMSLTPSVALGEAMSRRDRAALSVCRLLAGQGSTVT